MKKLALILPLALLAACGEEPAPEPTPTETATPEPVASLPATDQAFFSTKFAETCEGAEPVKNAVCRRAMGAEQALCEYGLGEDEYMRHEATLVANEDGSDWMIDNAEALCAEHGAHHKAS